jgi:hypothetical protein
MHSTLNALIKVEKIKKEKYKLNNKIIEVVGSSSSLVFRG